MMENIMLRLEAISHLNVRMLETVHILTNEIPTQAYARVTREAQLTQEAEIGSFDINIALYSSITSARMPDGHTFLAKALHDACRPIVQSQLISRRIGQNKHDRVVRLWIEIADRYISREWGRIPR
jgi:hypothetical protein